MPDEGYMIGIDIGTTSTKAVLFSTQGRPIISESVEYPLYTPTPSVAEQDPDQIFNAVIQVINGVVKNSALGASDVAGVCFSAAMHSLIVMDSGGRPLTRCLTWADNRSRTWAQKIKEDMNGHDVYRRTGTPIHPMSPLAKITWLRHEREAIFVKADKFISIKEYVFYRLFKQYIVDYSIASATGMFNLQKLNWDREALQIAGISTERLSEPVPATTIVRGLSASDAAALHLHRDTPFVIGASDGVLSNLGLNAIDKETVAVTIGTSGAVRTMVDRPNTDPEERTFCYVLTENEWVIGGAVNNGGIALRWLRDQLAIAEFEAAYKQGVDVYDLLTRMASEVQPGSEGLIFHPYLTGERAPLWNEDARASFFGLGLHHQKKHLVRAVLEGVIYNLFSVLQALEEVTGTIPNKMMATGGFARSSLWRQMMADIFDHKVIVPESYESSCLGAAVLGFYALRIIRSFDVVGEMVGAVHEHEPVKEHAAVYRRLLPIYMSLSRKLANEYREIAQFQRNIIKNA